MSDKIEEIKLRWIGLYCGAWQELETEQGLYRRSDRLAWGGKLFNR